MNDLNTVVESIKRGDTNGWSVVYQTYYNKLYRHALSLTDNDPQNAQDAVQGAFARAMSDNRIQTLKDNDKLFQWLSTFVLNEVRPMWRKQEKFMAFSTAEDYENTIDGIADDDICIPEDYAMDEAFKRRMKKAIESLTSQQRIVVQMYYYEGKTIPQIASAMKLSESSVKTHLTAARAKLKKYIENYEKSGNKFRVIVPIPFLFNKEMPKGIYTAGLKTAGTVMATKVLSGVLAGLLAANAAFGGFYVARALNPDKNKIPVESESNKNTESVITDNTTSDTESTKGKNADGSSISADSNAVEVNASENEFKEYTNGYYSFKFPEKYDIKSVRTNEVGLFLNEGIRIDLTGDRTYDLTIYRTEGFSNNKDLDVIKNDLSELYSSEENPSTLYDIEFMNSDLLSVTPYSNPDYIPNNNNGETTTTTTRPAEGETYQFTNVYTSNGFYIQLMVSSDKDEDRFDDETFSILESIKLNQDNFDKLSEQITAALADEINNTTVNYSEYDDNTPHKRSEVLDKYFDGDISYYVTKDNTTDRQAKFYLFGIHDGIELTFSWEISNHTHVSNSDNASLDLQGNIIEDYPDKFEKNMVDEISMSMISGSFTDVMYWYLDRPYQLDYHYSPNSALFDSTDITEFDTAEKARDAYMRNFEYRTEVIEKGDGYIALKSPYQNMLLGAGYDGKATSYWNGEDIIKLHHQNMEYKQFKKCSSMTDDDYRNLKVGDKVTVYYKFGGLSSNATGVPLYDLYIEH